ncbi:MAG: putative serine/threonine-protein kinase, partial [Cryobacterium sp.]|nr:putative serine/threonine-protein kinase [Cryobacterium sp.]
MTLSSENVLLVDGKGTLTASVHNASSDDERVVLGAFPPTDAPATGSPAPTWATVEKPLRSIAPEATEQYEVSFDTTGAAPGTYPVKLIPYSADEAPEDYADLAHIVTLEVPKPKPGPVPPPKWWIYVAAAAVVLLLIGVTVFL